MQGTYGAGISRASSASQSACANMAWLITSAEPLGPQPSRKVGNVARRPSRNESASGLRCVGCVNSPTTTFKRGFGIVGGRV
eukprot:scaffold251911_cov41-Tisochrysis_lutea.AAC.2